MVLPFLVQTFWALDLREVKKDIEVFFSYKVPSFSFLGSSYGAESSTTSPSMPGPRSPARCARSTPPARQNNPTPPKPTATPSC